jgi:hypothetical protein
MAWEQFLLGCHSEELATKNPLFARDSDAAGEKRQALLRSLTSVQDDSVSFM